MRTAGIIAGYFVVGVEVISYALGLIFGGIFLASLPVAIAAAIVLHLRQRTASIWLWGAYLGLSLALMVIAVIGSFYHSTRELIAVVIVLVTSIAAGLALFSALKLSRISRNDRKAAARDRVQQSAHARRVAQITEWEAAYRDAHDGAAPPAGFVPPVAAGATGKVNAVALTSFILSVGAGLLCLIIGLFVVGEFLIVGAVLGLVAAILGHIGLYQANRNGDEGRGFAVTGIIVGYALIAVVIALVIYVIQLFNSAFNF